MSFGIVSVRGLKIFPNLKLKEEREKTKNINVPGVLLPAPHYILSAPSYNIRKMTNV